MYKMEANWNRKLAFKAEGTAPALLEALRGFVVGNFVNLERANRNTPLPSLDDLLGLECGMANALSGATDDGTGRAAWAIWREC